MIYEGERKENRSKRSKKEGEGGYRKGKKRCLNVRQSKHVFAEGVADSSHHIFGRASASIEGDVFCGRGVLADPENDVFRLVVGNDEIQKLQAVNVGRERAQEL